MSLLDELLTSAIKSSYEKNKRKESEPSILGALKDPQFLQDMKRGVLDSVNRGAVASTIGGPVDLATMALRPLGYNVEKPAWGSEWVGDKMQQLGLLGDTRNPMAEAIASVAVPGAMAKVAPKVFQAEQAAIKNAQMPTPMNGAMRGQFGGVKVGEKFTYPQDAALETARQNGVKMLGLPENNTPMDRAKALGFDADVYHGTNRKFNAFSNDMLGAKTGAKSAQKAHFTATSPDTANSYVNTERLHTLDNSPPVYEKLLKTPGAFDEFNAAQDSASRWGVLEKYGMNDGSGQVMPLTVRTGNQRVKDYGGIGYRDVTYNDELKAAKKGGKDSVAFLNTYDPGPHGKAGSTDVYAVFDPSRIRSRFAAFDPARVNENDLLAGAMPFGLLLDPEHMDSSVFAK